MNKSYSHYLLGLSLILSGCSFSPTASQPPQATGLSSADLPCLTAAKYAKTLTFLKLAGISFQDLDSYTNVPVALQVPIAVLQAKVIATEYTTPADAYNNLLAKCSAVGWDKLKSSLEKELPQVNLKLDSTLSPVPNTKTKRKPL